MSGRVRLYVSISGIMDLYYNSVVRFCLMLPVFSGLVDEPFQS